MDPGPRIRPATSAGEAAVHPVTVPGDRPRSVRTRTSPIGGFLAIGAAVCLGSSAFCDWWTFRGPGSGGISITFLPGSSFTGTSEGSRHSASYLSQGLGPMGALYGSVLALLILSGGISLVVAGATFWATRDPGSRLARRGWPTAALAATLAFELSAALGVVALQPVEWARANPGGICQGFVSPKTICNSFWGSGSSSLGPLFWGPDVGWYLAVAASVLTLGALALRIAGLRTSSS